MSHSAVEGRKTIIDASSAELRRTYCSNMCSHYKLSHLFLYEILTMEQTKSGNDYAHPRFQKNNINTAQMVK